MQRYRDATEKLQMCALMQLSTYVNYVDYHNENAKIQRCYWKSSNVR